MSAPFEEGYPLEAKIINYDSIDISNPKPSQENKSLNIQ